MSDNTQTSPIVEKLVVDIDLVNGSLNESINEEAADWTKDLTDVQNLVPTPGQFVQRGGAVARATMDDTSAGIGPLWRLGALNGGVGVVGANYQLYHWNEATQSLANKGRMPEFSVQRKQAGGTGEVSSVCGVAGVAILTNYYVIAYHGETKNSSGTTVSQLIIDVLDKLSNNVVRSWTITSAGLHTYAMVGVDSRYLHIYRSLPGTTAPGMCVIDTNSLAASGAITPSFTNFTTAATTDFVTGVVAITGNSVAITTPTNNRIEKFNNSAVSVSTAAVAGFTTLSGMDTDGTNFYIAGRLKGLTSPSTLTLTSWWKTFTWTATASAGTSGTDTASGITTGTGEVLNGVTSLALTGTGSQEAGSATRNMGTSGTIIMLVKPLGATDIVTLQTISTADKLTWAAATGFTWFAGGNIPWPSNVWTAVALKWTGTSLHLKCNRMDWVSVTQTSIPTTATTLLVGAQTGIGCNLNIMELMAATSELTERQVDDVIDYFNVTYALKL